MQGVGPCGRLLVWGPDSFRHHVSSEFHLSPAVDKTTDISSSPAPELLERGQ